MATFTLFHAYKADLHHGVHNFSSHTLKCVLSNTAPSVSAHSVLADITQIAAGNGYTTGGNTVAITSSSQSAGLYKLVIADPTFTASGGPFPSARYAVLYNDTATGDPLIGFWDNGASVVVPNGEQWIVDGSAVLGVMQVA